MNSKIKKLKRYFGENGFKETIKKVYRYTSFKLKVKNLRKLNTVYRLSEKEEKYI